MNIQVLLVSFLFVVLICEWLVRGPVGQKKGEGGACAGFFGCDWVRRSLSGLGAPWMAC